MSHMSDIKKALEQVNIFLFKLEEHAKADLTVDRKATEVSGDARSLAIYADKISQAARHIANVASIKEQHDHFVDSSAQAEENFIAILQGREPNVIGGRKKSKA